MSDKEKATWRRFAEEARNLGSPLYESLSLAISEDPMLTALAARTQAGQPHPNLLLAAVHFLLLRGAQHPLRNFYATMGETGHGDVFSTFRDFVVTHRDQVAALVETRVTNTNEVGRSSILRAGFAALAARESAPLRLIEIGPSAGLNMIWDRYGMRYRRDGVVAAEIAPDAPLVLDCELRGEFMPPLSPSPVIAGCIGLERGPVNLSDLDDRDWLRALVWPDQPHRLDRLDRAIAMYVRSPPEILPGDALALLPGALARMPPRDAICVYHTIAVYQFSRAMKDELAAILVKAGRPLWHLSFEFDGADYALTLTRHQDGSARTERLALAQAHGGWMAWCG
jgi:hypothetical protein